MSIKNLFAAMLLLCTCAMVRAGDGDCDACKQSKPCESCATCDTAKRCASPVKNFFVHSVGGSIGCGLKSIPGKFDGACNTCAEVVTVKSDCGCNK